jgi:hypothetical protein
MKIIKKFKEKLVLPTLKLNLDKKEFVSSVLFLFIIYFLAIISIIRANFSYIDDLRRSIDSYGIDGVFSRHISKHLSHLLHASSHITDISPLPQLVACCFLAITGFLLVKIICNKTNKLLLIASLPIGLSPYFLECFSYKFDAPYMALSILASIFPFIFMQKNRWLYAFVCIASTLVMTMTYQAASGIFIMITIFIFFTNLNYKKNTTKDNFIFLIVSLISYCVGILLFRLFFMQPIDFGYASTYMPNAKDLITVFCRNINAYWTYMYEDLNIKYKVLLLAIIVIFYLKSIIFSKISKIFSFFLTSLVLVLLCVSSFGLYLLLEQPVFSLRVMYGLGVFIAILCIDICFSLKKVFSIPAIALIWCFFVFYFTYGNALADQKRYNDFRTELLLKDLSSLLPEKTENAYWIRIINSEGFSPVVKNIAVDNPIIKKLVPINLQGGWPFGYIYLTCHYNFHLNFDDGIAGETMPVVLDSYYHTIKNKDNQIVVILK